MKTFLSGRRASALHRLTFAAVGAATLVPATAGAAALGTNGAATPALRPVACDAALLNRFPDDPVQGRFKCFLASVPVDYRKPTGAKIDLAVSELPATGGPTTKTIFMNPGGPGARGRGVIAFATANLMEHANLVGFDPRGSGSTTAPVRCASTADEAVSLLNPTFPVNAVQEATATTKAAQGAKGCGQRTPASTLNHISTANTTRDLELLRKAFTPTQKLNFFSFSAGSLIGETYAQLFPTTAGPIALDSPLDPSKYFKGASSAEGAQPLDYRMKSYVGTDAAVTSFLTQCAANPATCAFADPGSTATNIRTKYNATLARIRANNGVIVTNPDTGEKTTVSYQDVVGFIFDELSTGIFLSQELAGYLATVDIASKNASAKIPNTDLQSFLKVLLRKQNAPIDPSKDYNDNFWDSFAATVCADTDHPTSGSVYQTYGRKADSEVAGLGPFWIYTTASCATWPVAQDVDRYTGPWTARPSTPILMLGNKLGDTASNYNNEITAASLTGARLVGTNSYGHTTYNLASSCVDTIVDNYLLTGALPPAGTSCDTDFGAFDPIPDEELASSDSADAGYARAN